MYTSTTKEFQDKVISDSRTFRVKLVCGSDIINSGVRSLKLSNKSVSGDTIELGAAVSAQLDMTVLKPKFMITGREFKAYIGLVMRNSIEYVPMGIFKAQRPKETDNGEITFTAYDRMVSVFKSPYFTDIKSYPADGKDILKEIQTKTGVKLANADTLPDGVMIDWRLETSDNVNKKVPPFQGYTYCETIGYIAQLYGKFATINRSGELELRWYNECNLQVKSNRITSDVETSEIVFTVQKIECSAGDETYTAGSGTMGISMNNPVMTQKLLNNVYKAIGGMEYLPASCSYLGDPRLDIGDIIKLQKKDGTIINMPVMSIEYEYDGGLTATIESVGSDDQTEIQKGPIATSVDRVYTELFLIKNVIANKVSVDYLEANYINTKEMDAVSAKIKNLETDNVEINNSLTVLDNAKVVFQNKLTTFEKKVEINEANIGTLTGNFASFKEGDFKALDTNVAKINTLIFGTAAGESISTEFSNSVIANVGTGMIKDAMIESLSVSKIMAGKISTSKFQIVSDSANMLLSDNTMQIKDTKRMRIQIGKDASGDFNMYVWDKSGKLMFDALGLTENGIQRPIVRNDMVSDDANISAEKIDINTLFSVINNDGSHTMNASKIYVDADKQTLDVSFKQMTTKVTESVNISSTAKTTASSALSIANTANTNASNAVKTANTATTTADAASSNASSAVTKANTATTVANAAKDSATNALSKADALETTVNTLTTKVTTQGTQLTAVQGQISSKVWQQDITTSISQLQIGGRNLFLNTNSTSHSGKLSWGQKDIIYLKGCENTNYAGTGAGNTLSPREHGYSVTVSTGKYACYYINGYDGSNNGGMGCLNKGSTYTISFDYVVKGYSNDTDDNNKYVRLSIYGNKNDADTNTTLFVHNFVTYTSKTKGNKVKGRCEYTFTVPDTASLSYIYFRIHFATSDVHESTNYIDFRNIKLEEGNKATDWTPAPEDIDENILSLEEVTEKLSTQYTTLKQNTESLEAIVNGNTTAISKKADGSTVTSLQTKVTNITADLDGFKTTVSSTYATNDNLSEKADKKSIISQINQTAETVKISASKLQLIGAVTFSCFDSATQSTINSIKSTAEAIDEVIAEWCYDKNKTYIDGAKIYTGSVTSDKIAARAITADKINVTDLTALGATIGGFNISNLDINSYNTVTKGVASEQYQVQLIKYDSSPTGLAFRIHKRNYDGSAYDSWLNKFYVRYDGYIAAYAGGRIGSWYLGSGTGASGGLYNGMTSYDDTANNGIWLGSNGIAAGKGSFKVSSAGNVTCQNISSSGNCTFTTATPKTGGIYTNGNISCVGNITSSGGALNVKGGVTSGGTVKGTYGTFSNTLSTSAGGGSIIGNLYVSGYATMAGGYGTSDKRLKQNIVEVNDEKVIILLEQLNPKMYEMKNDNSVKRVGFIAQDVQKILNDYEMDASLFVGKMVDPANTLKESYLTLNYSDLIGVLWKGWQILNAKIKQQEKIIAEFYKS